MGSFWCIVVVVVGGGNCVAPFAAVFLCFALLQLPNKSDLLEVGGASRLFLPLATCHLPRLCERFLQSFQFL